MHTEVIKKRYTGLEAGEPLFSRLKWNSCDAARNNCELCGLYNCDGRAGDICSCPGLNLFKWGQPANPNSTTPFEIQFSFNGLIESAEMCQNFFEMKI